MLCIQVFAKYSSCSALPSLLISQPSNHPSHFVPHPVGLRLANSWGIYDIAGNVREWCLDWFAEDAYKLAYEENPLGPEEGEFRVVRGACFIDRELFMRSSFRGFLAPEMVVNNQGFRVVCEE